ncbi:MAG: hypothetical protein ACTSR8_10260 [Promethearchaeota archaeon]
MIRKRYHQKWKFYSPDAVLTSSVLNCAGKTYIAFGGHDKRLYLMDKERNLLDSVALDGWVRCSYPIDLDDDGDSELLVGAGDGNFLVLKLDIEKIILQPIMNYVSSGKVLSCVAGDLFRNGNIELIFGGEDKTLRIFKNIKSKEPLYTFYYDSWVTSCNIGVFKHPEFSRPIIGLVVGTKSGILEMIIITDKGPDILWRENLNTEVNSIAIGDVINDGNNDIVVATNDSYIKIFDSEGFRLRYIKVIGGRPISFLIEDIDGDGANEIITGCSDGTLRVYQNDDIDSVDFELKWKTKVPTSIKTITYLADDKEGLKEIIFGGYDRTIRNIADEEFGKKPKIEVPPTVHLPKLKIPKSEELSAEQVPENLQEFIFTILEERGEIISLDLLKRELASVGYSQSVIDQEIDDMIKNEILQSERKELYVWSLSSDAISKETPVKKEEILEEQVIERPAIDVKREVEIELEGEITQDSDKKELITISTETELEKKILEILKEEQLIITKDELIQKVVAFNFDAGDVEKQIEVLRTSNKIKYSRSTPRGWSLFED